MIDTLTLIFVAVAFVVGLAALAQYFVGKD